jgi:hypothetical protein
LNENRKSCDEGEFFKLRLDKIVTDRLLVAGRRGTGKSTGTKLCVAEDGARVLWCTRTKTLSKRLPDRFVPPKVRGILPDPERLPSDPDYPLFKFGRGAVQTLPLTMVTAMRDTGISVDGYQADAIILDECFPPDGRYKRDEPLLLDDLAGTVGRSGTMPPIICLGNPISNRNPYAYQWHVNVLSEGCYEFNGRTTEVKGTAACRDCFGKAIGVDASPAVYAAHLDQGGDVVTVNGKGLRVRAVGSWLYVGTADVSPVIMMHRGHYTPQALTGDGTRFLLHCKQALFSDCCVFDSFDAELTFYELMRASE